MRDLLQCQRNSISAITPLLLGWLVGQVVCADLPPVINLYPSTLDAAETTSLHHTIQALRQELEDARALLNEKDKAINHLQTASHLSSKRRSQPITTQSKKMALSTSHATSVNDIAQKKWQMLNTMIKAKQYTPAITALQSFIKHYPKHDYSASAHYLLGQLTLLNSQPTQALHHFKYFIKQYPADERVPDATLQMGLAYYASHHNTMASQCFRQLQKNYPKHPAARQAQEQLYVLSQQTLCG